MTNYNRLSEKIRTKFGYKKIPESVDFPGFFELINCKIAVSLRIPANARNDLDFASLHLGHFLHSYEFQYTKRALQASLQAPLYTGIRSNPYLFEN